MTYRDAHDALEARIQGLEQDLTAERSTRASLQQRLEHAELALGAYRKSAPRTGGEPARMAWVVASCGALLWAAAVVSAIEGHDDLASGLAMSSAAFSAFAPLVAWAGARDLGIGLLALGLKVGASLFITFWASTPRSGRMSAQAAAIESYRSLFWWGPATMLVLMLVEVWLIGRRGR